MEASRVTRALLLALLLAGCSSAPADPCTRFVDSIYGCDELAPPVVDSIPWPDSLP